MKSRKNEIKFLLKISICFIIILLIFTLLQGQIKNSSFVSLANVDTSKEFHYLSDIPYKTGTTAWGNVTMDKANDDSLISVKIEGAYYTFEKGIWAHATSTLIYDLSDYSDYDYFTAYIGMNKTAANSSNGVKFYIYTSTDGNNWNLKTQEEPTVMRAGSNADFVKISIKDAKYLKLYANDNGNNGNDHAVYADAKLIKETYKEPGENLVPSIEKLEEDIKTKYAGADLKNNKEYEKTLLQREFINRVGNYALRRLLSENEQNKEVFSWLTNDTENLRLYLVGGKPEGGSYYNSLNVLSKLYSAHKDDLAVETQGNNGRPLKELYRKMMLSISLTHSASVHLWCDVTTKSNPVTRYEIYKKLYSEKKIEYEIFENLTVEEMRWVMNTIISDEEIEWLNFYTKQKGNDNPYGYVRYTSGYNYNLPQYYSAEERANWNKKYYLDQYNITYETKHPRLWIVFEQGAVCGGISKTGSCIWGSLKGLPNTCISQPGHCAYLRYYKNDNGDGIWSIWNNVTNWATSGRTEHLGNRMPNDWQPAGGWAASYILLAQAAQNEYNKYEEAEEVIMLAEVYDKDIKKAENMYRKALEIEKINYDAWTGLISVYEKDSSKTEEDWYNLAKEIVNELKYYPLPMINLLNAIEPHMQDQGYKAALTLLKTKALKDGTKTTTEQYIQPEATIQVANYLLGNTNTSVALFSFDGPNANELRLGSQFDGTNARWEYSIDGGKTWTETQENSVKLKPEQISEENDIKVHIIGVKRTEETIYTIDITKDILPNNLYANDLENRIIGADLTIEWRYEQEDNWTLYSVASPDLTGNKKIQVRKTATGTKLPSDESDIYTFTEDNQPNTRKYIGVSNLSIQEYSTQSNDSKRPFYAPNVIDGNINTIWHTDFRYNVTQQEVKPFITIKLNEPKYISALEFIQTKYKAGDPDFIKNGIVYISEDGKKWTEAGRIENCPQNNELRDITFNKSIYGQYVKLEMETYNMFASLAMVNLFEDITKIENIKPTAGIYYSTQEKTNQHVIARLVNPSTEITITNNNGKDTYVFTENGKFTFEFVDKKGNKGTAEAIVNWIDKDSPTADIKYGLDADKKLLILLDNISEDVYLLDENNKKINFIQVDKNKKVTNITYLDNQGEAYKILDKDENGKTKKITYKNITGKVPSVDKYITILENDVVTSEQYLDSEGNPIELTSKEDKDALKQLQETTRSNPLEYALQTSGEYEFKLLDKAENILYKSIKVDYINNDTKILASDITYNITRQTNQNVEATINPYIIDVNGNKDVDVVLTNNKNEVVNNKHIFTENGKFIFKYKEASDKDNWEEKQHEARVDWIDKTAPTAQISYNIKEPTKQSVVATLVNESEEIIIINNGTSKEHIFTKNGEFVFEFIDKAGNKGSATAKVDWIKTEQEKPAENQLGDINKDGKITATDLLLLKRHLVAGKKQEWILKGDEFKLGDINKDGKITATDLILIKRLVLKQIK